MAQSVKHITGVALATFDSIQLDEALLTFQFLPYTRKNTADAKSCAGSIISLFTSVNAVGMDMCTSMCNLNKVKERLHSLFEQNSICPTTVYRSAIIIYLHKKYTVLSYNYTSTHVSKMYDYVCSQSCTHTHTESVMYTHTHTHIDTL